MFKLIDISGDTLRLDEQGVSKMVTDACRRASVYIEGIAVDRDRIMLIGSENGSGKLFEYHFTPLGEISFDGVAAELRSRYNSNFRTVGAFILDDGVWTLTEKAVEKFDL